MQSSINPPTTPTRVTAPPVLAPRRNPQPTDPSTATPQRAGFQAEVDRMIKTGNPSYATLGDPGAFTERSNIASAASSRGLRVSERDIRRADAVLDFLSRRAHYVSLFSSEYQSRFFLDSSI
jgi:hypothetical protein